MAFDYSYHCRVITCVYRKNSARLEDDIKSAKENLLKRTEKLQQVRKFFTILARKELFIL